jgi:DNA-binding transcriptional MerR regulator
MGLGMAPDEKTLTLKEMVKRSGSTPRTIRFYEEVGLITPVGRTQGGHRLYRPSELEKLSFISDLRDAGVSLEEIKELLDLRASSQNARDASQKVSQLLHNRIEDLKRRLGVLARLRDELAHSVDIFQKSCADCKHPPGNEVCDTCTDIDHARLPRAFRWLWNVH